MTLQPLSWHPRLAPVIAAAMSGRESFALIGPPGTGKTFLLEDAVERQRAAVSGSAVFKVLGRLRTPGQLLTNVLEWLDAPPGPRLHRRGPTAMLPVAAERIATTGTTVVVLDEAQYATADAINHLLLVRDACLTDFSHQVAFVLLGPDALTTVLTETGQRGQRLAVVLESRLLPGDEMLALVPQLMPRCFACIKGLARTTREGVDADLVNATAGSVRRTHDIEERAKFLASANGGVMTLAHVRAAIAYQAP